MKTFHLVNLLLAVTFVHVSADRAVSAELTHLAAVPKAIATQIAHTSAVEDWSTMKTIQTGGNQADGLTAVRIGKTIGYMDASGRFMGLATP